MDCDKEFVCPGPGAVIGSLDCATYSIGKFDQNGIANLVSIALVDQTEMLNIQVQERAQARAFKPDPTILYQRLFIEQTGKRVMGSEIMRLLKRPFLFRNVDAESLKLRFIIGGRRGAAKAPLHQRLRAVLPIHCDLYSDLTRCLLIAEQ